MDRETRETVVALLLLFIPWTLVPLVGFTWLSEV
jgi:hypothetical protein